jgi:hypothetical protein
MKKKNYLLDLKIFFQHYKNLSQYSKIESTLIESLKKNFFEKKKKN